MHIQLDFTLPWWVFVLLVLWMAWRIYVGTWTHFLAIFHLKKVEQAQGLGPVSRFMGYWVLLPRGLWLDWQLNQWLTLLFLDPPHTPWEVVTGRLQRYINPQVPSLEDDAPQWLRLLWPARMVWWRLHRWWWELMPWRRSFADALAKDKLDPYDLPSHIRR